MLELALIENLQREHLNPMEIATSYQRLIDECRFTQEEVAQKNRQGPDDGDQFSAPAEVAGQDQRRTPPG